MKIRSYIRPLFYLTSISAIALLWMFPPEIKRKVTLRSYLFDQANLLDEREELMVKEWLQVDSTLVPYLSEQGQILCERYGKRVPMSTINSVLDNIDARVEERSKKLRTHKKWMTGSDKIEIEKFFFNAIKDYHCPSKNPM